jgi:hypothetical protein
LKNFFIIEKKRSAISVPSLLKHAQIYGLASIIDIRGSGIGREVKVRFFKSRSYCGFDDAWILERSFRLELFSRYHQDDEVSPGGCSPTVAAGTMHGRILRLVVDVLSPHVLEHFGPAKRAPGRAWRAGKHPRFFLLGYSVLAALV